MLGQPDKAISSIYEAKDLFERESNQSGVAMTWHEIGRVAVITKDYRAAEKPLREAIRIHEESGDNLSIGRNLLGLGLVYLKHHHNIPQARECYSRALRLFELAGSISDANQARHNLQTLDVEEAVDPSANF